MNELLERLSRDFQDEEGRYAYADSVVNAFVSAQIKALRENRDLSQEKLAELMGTKQSGVSRLERADYSAWKIETLRKLARAFGVRLRISFAEFGTLLEDIGGFKDHNLLPRRFEDDPAFQETKRSDHRKMGRKIRFSNVSRKRHSMRRRKHPPTQDIARQDGSPVHGAGSSHPTLGNDSGRNPLIGGNQVMVQSGGRNGN